MEKSRQVLSSGQLQAFSEAVRECFDKELLRAENKDYITIIYDKFQELHLEFRAHTFFTPAAYSALVDQLFTKPTYIDFIMSITDQVSIETSCQEYGTNEQLCNTIVQGMQRSHAKPDSVSLLNDYILKSLEINEDDLIVLLQHNFWLIVVYFLLSTFVKTNIHQAMTQSSGPGKK